jgi:phosphoadenosine phosphosulfate reductase
MPGKNSPMLVESDTQRYLEAYAGLEGRNLIAAVAKDFDKRAALLSSFGAESAVLLHMVSEVAPNLKIVFLDTEKLFAETQVYRDQLISEFGLTNVKVWKPALQDIKDFDPKGDLNQHDKDLCCNIRKTLPMRRALHGVQAVISGRKRFHGALRSKLDFVSVQDGLLKIEPLAGSTALDLQSYALHHHLPSHPLKLQGYFSIGCVPCTVRGGSEEKPREGRWMGTEKTECGIHFAANGQIIRTVSRQPAGVTA